MDIPTDRGLLDMKSRVLARLMADTAFKDSLRDLLMNIDPENSRKLVRTFMGRDLEVPLALVSALPAVANCLIKAADELITLIHDQFSPELLREFARSLMSGIDRESLLRASAGARRLADELSPVLRDAIGQSETRREETTP